ncbi:hypothetical protein ACGVWS_02800 [Enterobacteriaceae bacterium LUAb1]
MMFSHIRYGILALLLCLPVMTFAVEANDTDEALLLTGTIGDHPVVVTLSRDEGKAVYGRYYYVQYHQDIALEGKQKEDTLILKEGQEDSKSRPVFTLKSAGDRWQGSWNDKNGKILPIILNETEIAVRKDDDVWWSRLRETSPYDYLRMRDVPLQQGESQVFMGYRLKWLTDPVSGLRMFQVVSGYAPDVLTRINTLLRTRLYNEIISYHECMVSDRFSGEEFEQHVDPKLLTPVLLSADIFTRYNCGGAHPDFGRAPINLNITNARTLSLEDILWAGKGKPFHFADVDNRGEHVDSEVNFDRFSEYRSKIFAPWLAGTLTALYPKEMETPQDDEDCDYSDESIWQFPVWYMTPEGINIDPSFPRALRACEGPGWSLLPWRVVKQYPGGVALALP